MRAMGCWLRHGEGELDGSASVVVRRAWWCLMCRYYQLKNAIATVVLRRERPSYAASDKNCRVAMQRVTQASQARCVCEEEATLPRFSTSQLS